MSPMLISELARLFKPGKLLDYTAIRTVEFEGRGCCGTHTGEKGAYALNIPRRMGCLLIAHCRNAERVSSALIEKAI